MRKDNSTFVTSFLSEAGTFLHNHDYFAYTELDDMAFWVIARGLDSDKEANSAELAVKSILGNFMENPTMSRIKIRSYLQQAHEVLQAESQRVRLKASLTLVVTDYSKIVYAVAGNARIYLFRNGRFHARSSDQSLSQLMVSDQKIPEHRLDHHEERHNLTNYLGKPNEFTPYVSKKFPLSDGDVMLLCTPGLWENISTPEMTDALAEANEPTALVDTLEEVLLSKQSKVVDNYTAAAIFADKVFMEDPYRKWQIVKKVAIAVFLFLLLGGGTYVYMARQAAVQAEAAASILEHEKNGDTYITDGNYPLALKEYSEARNASIKVKDKVHAELIGRKQRIVQLIVDGDSNVKDNDFVKALDKYQKALQEAKKRSDFNIAELEAKIRDAQTYKQIMVLMKDGDLRFEAQDYLGAKDLYQKARKAAILSSFSAGEKELRVKLDEVEDKITSLQKEIKMVNGDKMEKIGDNQLEAQDLVGAIESYSLARDAYQEIGMLEKVLTMERKIAKAEEELDAMTVEGMPVPDIPVPDMPAQGGSPVPASTPEEVASSQP
ncbi:PP2C family protein-serine/threonine phosphatase [Brevibacillus sp. SYSU BS000544]|uniref:PP2C family protein-serine/threonine phosphatase n=1 Tax=Brevibacillus sp. SYSU BS000544 TaxID=3416443 RepID=UPI003CE44884